MDDSQRKGQTEKREREWEGLSELSELSELNEGEYQRERRRAVLRVGGAGREEVP